MTYLFLSYCLRCNKIIKALKALSLLWPYLPGIHPPVCHQELIHPSPPARQQRAAVSCSVEGDTFTMQSRDGVSEPTVGWWQEGELWTVNWAVIDCFLPHNRYHKPANYTPDQQRLFVMQIQEFLCTVCWCSSIMEACFMVLTKVWDKCSCIFKKLKNSRNLKKNYKNRN